MTDEILIEPNRDRPGYAGGEPWADWFERKTSNANKAYKQIDKTILRKKDKATRFFVDNEYVEKGYLAALPHQTTSVYIALIKHCNTKTQSAFPALKTLQKLAGIKNRNSLISSISLLEDLNIIQVVRTKGGVNCPNHYGFVNSNYWVEINPYYRKHKFRIKQYQKNRHEYQKDDGNEYQN
jgi:hypothetical protein